MWQTGQEESVHFTLQAFQKYTWYSKQTLKNEKMDEIKVIMLFIRALEPWKKMVNVNILDFTFGRKALASMSENDHILNMEAYLQKGQRSNYCSLLQ